MEIVLAVENYTNKLHGSGVPLDICLLMEGFIHMGIDMYVKTSYVDSTKYITYTSGMENDEILMTQVKNIDVTTEMFNANKKQLFEKLLKVQLLSVTEYTYVDGELADSTTRKAKVEDYPLLKDICEMHKINRDTLAILHRTSIPINIVLNSLLLYGIEFNDRRLVGMVTSLLMTNDGLIHKLMDETNPISISKLY